MYLKGSFLTPIIYDAPHWSKPPLHFWLPMPLYKLFGNSFLLFGRLSVLLLSLACTFLISLWYERELKRNWIEAFFFLITPLYFIKYSRIFMMEMPLTLLSVLGSLYFYSFLTGPKSNKKTLLTAVFFTALSVLIKGPVSLLMIFPACFIFALLKKKKGLLDFISFSSLSVLLASLWFVLSIFKYGQSFIDYFFIRENLGKFTAKNYPISSVFQGLIIYSFPVNLFSFALLKKRHELKLNLVSKFLLLNFFFFFALWLLPKQKSHHYAIPSIPFLCLFLSYHFFSLQRGFRRKIFKLLNGFYTLVIVAAFLIGLFLFYFQDFLSFTNPKIYFSGAFACLGLWTYLQKKPLSKAYLLSFLLPFIILWQFILPLAFLPIVPNSMVRKIQESPQSEFFVSYRKPFFIFEAARKEGQIISRELLGDPRIKKNDFVFGPGSIQEASISSSKLDQFKTISEWYSWRRGVSPSAIYLALKNKNLRSIQTHYLLLQKI